MTAPISRAALQAIEAARREQSIFVSAISVWELAMLVVRKRFELNKPVRTWVQEAFEQPDIQLLPLAPDIAVEATELPGTMHKDLADRIILASARVEGLTLITSDQPMLSFAQRIGLRSIRG